MSVAAPVSLFYSYAHEDEAHRRDLEGHLKILERRGLVQPWHDRKIAPGTGWDELIDHNLNAAELVLLLLSKDFIASDYIWGKELKVAMDRHHRGEARVVPILVRAVNIEPGDAPFMELQGLPTDLRPVTSWPNVDEAWTNVAKGLRATVFDIQTHREPAPSAPGGSAVAPLPATATDGPRDISADAAAVPQKLEPSAPGDELLGRVVDGIAQQIRSANAVRHGPPLDASALRQQVLRLIDTPQQKRVLWVDDRPQGNALEMATLAKLQVEVVCVRSTSEAMLRIGSDPEPFDLVISDWERSSDGAEAGLELLKRMREANVAPPLVFYHGEFGSAKRAERAAQAQAAGALGEAILPGELLALVLKAFN